MTERLVIHSTFSIERTYPAPPSSVFAAFASEEAKSAWGDTGNIETQAGEEAPEFDFRAGGRERFTIRMEGSVYRYDALYYDIVPGQRIVYCYEMYRNGTRLSVSLATIEFAGAGDGTALTWTEQGAYLDGIDGAGAPALREEGTAEMLDGLASHFATQALPGNRALPGNQAMQGNQAMPG
jgi:uncharacterized protein YndB with AHSA1/START domain